MSQIMPHSFYHFYSVLIQNLIFNVPHLYYIYSTFRIVCVLSDTFHMLVVYDLFKEEQSPGQCCL